MLKNKNQWNINHQISEIFRKLPIDIEIWREINKKYDIDLFCGLFLRNVNEGVELSLESLKY